MCSNLPQVQDIHLEVADMAQDLQDNKPAFGIGSWRPDRSCSLTLGTPFFKGFPYCKGGRVEI